MLLDAAAVFKVVALLWSIAHANILSPSRSIVGAIELDSRPDTFHDVTLSNEDRRAVACFACAS